MGLCEKVWMTSSGANRNQGFTFRFGQKLTILPMQTHQTSFSLEYTATVNTVFFFLFLKYGHTEPFS